jgi:hypothetical protein
MTGIPVGFRKRVEGGPMFKTIVVLLLVYTLLVVTSTLAFANDAPQRELVKVIHIVKSGETLDEIANFYLPPDREFKEFREGIYELNYDKLKDRPVYEVRKGDFLDIQFWAILSYD